MATGFILCLWIDALPRPPYVPKSPPPWERRPPISTPLSREARRLIDATAFPLRREMEVLYADPARGLQFFEVGFGHPQDCLAGCFCSSAIGVQTRTRAGWVTVNNEESDTNLAARLKASMFVPTKEDGYLLSQEFSDAVEANDRRRFTSLATDVRLMALRSPFI